MSADTAAALLLGAAGPTEPRLPTGTDVMAREAMWWAWATRSAPPVALPAAPAGAGYDDDAPVPLLPPGAAPAGGAVLPYGTVDLLADLPYPHGRLAGADLADGQRLGHALVAAFGLHRREPGNVFNDHRGYASVRSRFPVSVLVREPGSSSVLDVYRHRLAPLPGAVGGDGLDVVLTGRWARLPAAYRWFRGSLVGLETGIALRALHVATDLLGIAGRTRPPGASGERLLHDLGLVPARDWSLPVVVHLGGDRSAQRPAPSPRRPDEAGGAASAGPPDDPVLDQVVAADRAQRDGADAAPVPGVPALTPRAGGPSWGEVMWRRTSGRMPRGLYGMGGRPGPVPQEAVLEAAAWAALPPPGALPAAAFRALTTTVVLQQVEGQADGVHRVRDGALALVRPARGVARELEAEYGYPLAPGNGCDVRHAQAVWLLSVRPRVLLDEHGPGSWTAAQHACGWVAHGLTLAAAASGLYARPVRAFQEAPVQRLVGLAPDEMVVLAVITGLPRHPIPLLDLRT